LKYHRRYKHFNKKTLRATKELMKNWGNDEEAKNLAKMRKWIEQVSKIYQINFPMLKIIRSAGEGCYSPLLNEIYMARLSIVTLLHEFRHAMQAQGKAPQYRWQRPLEAKGGAEDDARAWSLSLYYKVAPRGFKRLASANQIYFVSAEDI
jgi:hypothetical protein